MSAEIELILAKPGTAACRTRVALDLGLMSNAGEPAQATPEHKEKHHSVFVGGISL
jgi:hypothetical protein